MTIRTCPYCAEEIQTAALLCKHCGQQLTQAPLASPPVASPPQQAGQILAAMKAFIFPGRWSALICTPDALVLKPVIPPAVGMIVPIIGALMILLLYPLGMISLVFIPIFLITQKNKVAEWGRVRQYAGAIKEANDTRIALSTIRKMQIENSLARQKVTVVHAGGKEVIYLEKADAARLQHIYPGLMPGGKS